MRLAAFSIPRLFIVTLLVCFAATSAHAAAAVYNPKTQQITTLNRIDPLQNPQYESASDILKRRMLDRKNRVVGSIRDIVINENGNIAYIDVDFDRMKLGRPVFVNYGSFNVKAVANGYSMAFDAKEIENLYPSMLAEIETAAGEEDTYALSKMKGLELWTASGRRIGTVSDVLFGSEGRRAELLYVSLTTGNLRGAGVAIPFGQADYSGLSTKRRVTLPDDTAEAVLLFAEEN
jgi:sporulation protein YlmC with PRC-barrel domain